MPVPRNRPAPTVRAGASLSSVFAIASGLIAVAWLAAGCASLPFGHGSTALQVEKKTLANGLRVVIVRDPLAPVVTQQVTYFAGGNQSPPGFPGTAHAQEHMMFRGAPGLSGDQLSAISAQLGGDMDAYTTQDTTTYYFTVPKDDLALTLRIDALRMAGVDDAESDWQIERGAIEQEVSQDNSNPLYVLQTRALSRMFAGTPYRDTGLGTKESFDKTSAAMLKSFHDAWYAPNNALLVVAGDVNPGSVMSMVESYYGSIPRRPVPEKDSFTFQPVSAETFTSSTDEPYGLIAYVFRMPGYTSSDYPAAQVLSNILNSRRGAISALAYNGDALASGFVYQKMVSGGLALVWAAFPPGADEHALAAKLETAVHEAVGGLSEDLVAAERKRIVLSSELQRNTVSGLAQAWTDAVALQGLDSPQDGTVRLQKVDLAAVKSAASDFLAFDHAITLVLTPTPGSQPTQGGQFGSPESFASNPTKEVALPDWAQKALTTLPDPKPLYTPQDTTLPNGIRLLIQPLPDAGAVSLYGSVHTNGDLQTPDGKEGVGDIMDALFAWGPEGQTRDQFNEKMDAIGAAYSTGTSFSFDVLPDEFDSAVKLIADDVLRPAFPADAFQSQQRIQAQSSAGQLASPVFKFNLGIQEALLPAGDPYLRISTPQSIGGLSLDDVRAYYRRVMRPDETTIVVMGDVDPQAVRTAITRYFGAWRAEGPPPNLDYPAVPRSGKHDLFVSDPVREQDQVVLAETVDLTYDDPVHYAIALGNSYVGGDSFANPLYREVRVKRGLVYSIGSSAAFGKTRSDFEVDFGAAPESVSAAKQLSLQLIAAMGVTPLTDDQLHLAKASALRKIELTNESVRDVATGWIGYAQEGLPLDRLYTVAARYRDVTSTEIRDAFRAYIDVDRMSTFILGRQVE